MKNHWVFDALEACRPVISGSKKIEDGPFVWHRSHLLKMLDRVRDGTMSSTKACRWLGWIQACLCFSGALDLEGAKEMNRIASREFPRLKLADLQPYGWWDTFNAVLHMNAVDADRARQGGNKVIPLYAIETISSVSIHVTNISSDRRVEERRANDTQVGGTHYMKHGNFQPWDAWWLWGLNAFQGAILKYVVRYRDKNGLQDLEKAKHYLEKLIECEKEPKP